MMCFDASRWSHGGVRWRCIADGVVLGGRSKVAFLDMDHVCLRHLHPLSLIAYGAFLNDRSWIAACCHFLNDVSG